MNSRNAEYAVYNGGRNTFVEYDRTWKGKYST